MQYHNHNIGRHLIRSQTSDPSSSISLALSGSYSQWLQTGIALYSSWSCQGLNKGLSRFREVTLPLSFSPPYERWAYHPNTVQSLGCNSLVINTSPCFQTQVPCYWYKYLKCGGNSVAHKGGLFISSQTEPACVHLSTRDALSSPDPKVHTYTEFVAL